ncbi:MAG: alanine racemase, partial [Desulfovibrio sp.]|nr:alanine racemase [Desulfovibrio sp.]
MSLSFSPARAHIDLNAIKRNFQRFGSADRILPVVKADAYGHGLLKTSQALLAVGARRFAVGTVAEGVALREAGIKVRIVVLLPPISRDEWRAAEA